jgi:hypothetical protein
MRISRLAIVVAVLAVAPASATDTSSKLPPSRYIFNRVADGFMRLDNQTGQVAHCNQRDGAWICQLVPERRAALEEEIVRLRDKIASLQKEIARLRAQPVAAPASKPMPEEGNAGLKTPTHDNPPAHGNIARARAFIVNTWRQLMDMLANLQRDVTRKG